VKPETFRKSRRHAIVGNFVIPILSTPPDDVSQIAFAGCLIFLSEAAILVGTRITKPRTEP